MMIPDTAGKVIIAIYNLQGAQLNAINISGRGAVTTTIPGGSLGAGMYFIFFDCRWSAN